MKDAAIDYMPLCQYESLAELEDYYWWHQGKFKTAISILQPHIKNISNPILYMDVGCGTGGFLKGLSNAFNFQQIIGLDGSPAAIDFMHKRGLPAQQVDLRNSFLEQYRESCGLITAMDVFEHMDDEPGFLKMVHHYLEKNGLFLLSVPAYNFLFSSWDKTFGHKRRYTKQGLSSLLRANNFNLLKATYVFSYILPIVVIRRFVEQKYTETTCEFPRLPRFVNATLLKFSNIEAQVIQHTDIPFGLSVMCLAQKR